MKFLEKIINRLNVYIDLNIGMDRTGIKPGLQQKPFFKNANRWMEFFPWACTRMTVTA